MTIEYRSPAAEELRSVLEAAETAFADDLHDVDWEREQKTLVLDRVIGAFDDGRPVGTAAAYEFELTIPGGQLPCAGVTWVGVMPSHRRRGILREFMRRQLEDVHRRGEAIAALWASESAIYGRFGYGLAAPNAQIRADRAAFGFRDDPGPSGVVRLVDAAEAKARFPEVYERVRPRKPGMLTRTEHWWEQHRLSDPEHHRDGASRRFYALLELEGRAEGYALYRVKNEWEAGVPQGQVRVLEAVATSPAATRELWRFVFGIDLTTRVDMWTFDPQSPLVLMVADPRRLHLTISDGLWLRLVDVDAALRAREYGGGGSIVLEVRDEICPWNNGRYRAGEDAGGTDDEPELRLDVADLASAYLGGFDVARLAAAGRVDELRDGAVARATSIFRTLVPPHCPEVF